MDHSMHMQHMDHDHIDHGDMDMGAKCSMNMLFTWSSENLCIVFRQWHISGPLSFILSLILIVLLTSGYEGVRQLTRKYEAAHNQRLAAFAASSSTGDDPNPNMTNAAEEGLLPGSSERSPLVVGRDNRASVARKGKFTLAAMYSIQVFYSFFIMLLFMTYNGGVMLAVAVGAFVGYIAFADDAPSSKTIACH